MSKIRGTEKIVLGMSGGVDSTTAALLLKEAGYEVIGCFFDIKKAGEYNNELKKAEIAARELDIELVYENVFEDFNSKVKNNFCYEYSMGRTPNPCIICNPNIKFKTLIKVADKKNIKKIATGHYVRNRYIEKLKRWAVLKGKSSLKDQSYMLYRLDSQTIERTVFPLGNIKEKNEVRRIAKDSSLFNSEARDSQGICFLEEGENYVQFLKKSGVVQEEGDFVDLKGKVIGRHKGILNYTLGQRKGLGMTFGKPMYVVSIDAENNRIVLGENEALFCTEVEIDEVVGNLDFKFDDLTAKSRHITKYSPCTVKKTYDGKATVVFKDKQRAVTPGQSLVIYWGEVVIGGGIVKNIKL